MDMSKTQILFANLAAVAVATTALADNRCEGDACGAVSNQWDRVRQKHAFHNGSNRPVEVVLDGMYTGQNTLRIQPGATEAATFTAFRMPYHAHFTGPAPKVPMAPPPRPSAPPPAVTTYTFVNNSGAVLYLYYAVTGPGTIDCKDLRDGGGMPDHTTKQITVSKNQVGWARFQLNAAGGCDSRFNKFESHVQYDPARAASTIPIL
jgi:hypothetical protein